MINPDSMPKDGSIHEKVVLKLNGSLAAFEGTPMTPLIHEALTEAGIPVEGHSLKGLSYPDGYDNYYGLPVDTPDEFNPSEHGISPIVTRMQEAVQNGEVRVDAPDFNTLRFRREPLLTTDGTDLTFLTEKLMPIGLRRLTDVETGEVVCYQALMNTDGGRPGCVILPTSLVE